MTSQPGNLTISIQILRSISKHKGNLTMKFSSWWNITWETFFLKNNAQNILEKLFPRPFLKNQIWAYLWINSLKFYIVSFSCREIFTQLVFILCQVRVLKILKLCCRSLAFTSYKASLENEKRSGTGLRASFAAWFLKKNISRLIFY